MKISNQIPVMFMIGFIAVMNGCEYDGPTAVYKQKHTYRDPAVITGLSPANQALAGVNYITIQGSNFSQDSTKDIVYIDNYRAEIVEHSPTSITIRRPNHSGDTTVVNVSSFGALEPAQYKPYKITRVAPAFGGFISPSELAALLVDKNENLFVVENNSARNIYKITPDEQRTVIANANATINDAALAANGNIILFEKKKEIYFVDVASGVDTATVYATVGKNVTRGCLDRNDNLYTSGLKESGLFVVKPDRSFKTLPVYAKDEILCLRENNNYLYLLIKLTAFNDANPQLAIWRHEILDGEGTLGNAALVLNWAKTGDAFSKSTPKSFTISDDGKIYIGTDAANPVLFFDPVDGSTDILYKSILSTSAEKLLWGNGHYMYMVLGRTNWNLFRIDMGLVADRDLEK